MIINNLFNIVTPCSRPENLSQIYDHISLLKKHEFFLMWWIIYDSNKVDEDDENIKKFQKECLINKRNFSARVFFHKGSNSNVVGNAQRSKALDFINMGWIYFLDDDNLVHEDFLGEFRDILNNNPDIKGAIFAQDRLDDLSVILDPTQGWIGYKKTDSSQYILDKEIIGKIRWIENDYNADGQFIEDVYNLNKNKIFLSNRIVSYRNKLR